MKRPVRQAYLDMIAKQVGPVLRGHGFRRSHGTFRRISDAGHAAVIEFQGSTSSWGSTSLFYVNLGVATASSGGADVRCLPRVLPATRRSPRRGTRGRSDSALRRPTLGSAQRH
ncbi:DUF4304 domain-containing protein [Micromonospora sp. WP24]|uniref:DUF4304 domain-containing protein n=1 Tax=Micromonospora sp. WP24 TaxID=2604469 RepID=UPI0011D8D8FF|nr:DUF4304 domain-containing protein [Micromonospora sp. WP24]